MRMSEKLSWAAQLVLPGHSGELIFLRSSPDSRLLTENPYHWQSLSIGLTEHLPLVSMKAQFEHLYP